jgi:peptidoglycan-N-acetylglucosamine deacetylase
MLSLNCLLTQQPSDMMKAHLFSIALMGSGICSLACAQSGETPAVAAADVPSDVVVRRAVPVEEPTVVNTETLPRELPADAKVVYSQCIVESNVIAITFDDGPDPEGTPRLLDMLKERGIKATFFLVGRSVATWPDIVKRIAAEGHEVANHTWMHPQLSHHKQTRVMDELRKTHDAIVKACGVAPVLYRPPYGAILLSQRKSIHERFQYPMILWDVDSMDWRSPRSPAKVHDRVIAQTKPGSIILCHDIHHETVDAMPATLDDLKARGFQFATVSQLINLESRTLADRAAFVAAAHAQASGDVPAPSPPGQPVPAAVDSAAPAIVAPPANP